MKPSYDEQRRNRPRTDRKFIEEDEHLAAQQKEEVAKDAQGDELESLVRQHPDNAKKGK